GSINHNTTETPHGNAISTPSEMDTMHVGGRPFIYGVSTWGGGDVFWGNKPFKGFFGRNASDTNGNFTTSERFVVHGSSIGFLQINFNQYAQQWATEMIINGQTVTNDSPRFLWFNPSPTQQVEILVTKWNTPRYPVQITSILAELTIEYTRKNFEKGGRIVAGSQKTANASKLVYGAISQYGSFELEDIDGNILELNEMGMLTDKVKVTIEYNNEPMGSYLVKKQGWTYMWGDRRVRAKLEDALSRWDSIYFRGRADNIANTALTFFNALNAAVGNVITISQEERNYFNSVRIPDGFLLPGNFKERLTGFCIALGSVIYMNRRGIIEAVRYG
ncbi:MAG: hypothetical protein FWE31_05980, partial [Firmicutes bacterium]|nr:hypothetical protein [Bacillota bacterium]